ncbi:MAG: hypothetical protein ACLFNK_04075 [Candidatus Woesearchaeota archaeon]
MKYAKNLVTILAAMLLMAVSVTAQPELPDPGITPDSPFYFIDRMMDTFRSPEVIMDRRAAEISAMAEKGHERGLEKATDGYNKAIERRQEDAEADENMSEEVARQSSNHLAILSRVREQVPEQAKAGIDRAINESATGRENALGSLDRHNPERAESVADTTLEEVMANAPDEAHEGLQRALDAVRSPGADEGRGRPSDLPTDEADETEIQTGEDRVPDEERTDGRAENVSEEELADR